VWARLFWTNRRVGGEMCGEKGIGYIGLFRELLNKPIWLNSTAEQKVILITILLMANHQEKDWEWGGSKFKVRPGQFVTSLESILKNCGKDISLQNLRTALKRFVKLEFLTDESTKTGRLITIVNWELYQVKKLRANKATNIGLTNDSQTPNKDLTPNKNENNVNKVNNEAKKFADDSLELIYAYELYNLILGNNPSAPNPNFQAWAEEFDMMMRIDKRNIEDIRKVMWWSQKHSFWQGIIQSPGSLRKHVDALTAQMNTRVEKNSRGTTSPRSKTSPDKYAHFYQ